LATAVNYSAQNLASRTYTGVSKKIKNLVFAGCFFLALGFETSYPQDIYVDVRRGITFKQISGNPPTTAYLYDFSSDISLSETTASNMSAIRILAPNGTARSYMKSASASTWSLNVGTGDRGVYFATVADGDYNLEFTHTTLGKLTSTFLFPKSTEFSPSIPYLDADDFAYVTSAYDAKQGKTFSIKIGTLTGNIFGGTVATEAFLMIWDGGDPIHWGTTIPAGTLRPGKEYEMFLWTDNWFVDQQLFGEGAPLIGKSISVNMTINKFKFTTLADKVWEGADGFVSPARWYPWQKKGKNGEQANLYLQDGRLIFASSVPYPHGLAGAVWLWGRSKKPASIPTSSCWEVSFGVDLPEFAPVSGVDVAVPGLAVVHYTGKTSGYPAIHGGLWASYTNSSNHIAETLQFAQDFNFKAGANDDQAPVILSPLSTGSRKFIIRFTHHALTQIDRFDVIEEGEISPAQFTEKTSSMSLYTDCQVGPFIMVGQNQTWPGTANNMAIRSWSVKEINPDPIDLNVQNSSSKGVVYSVAVTGLDLMNQKLTGTVAMTVGTASASLPITGSINKNGFFALTAKGAGASKGFGCVLLYDVATGTYLTSKNTVTAPKQTAIKF
jgi:hypothetical protein